MAIKQESSEPYGPTSISRSPDELLGIADWFRGHKDAGEFIAKRERGLSTPEFVIARLVSYFDRMGTLKRSPRAIDNDINYKRMRRKIGNYLDRVEQTNPVLARELDTKDLTGKTVVESLRERYVHEIKRQSK